MQTLVDEGSTSWVYLIEPKKTVKKVLKRGTKGLTAYEQFKIQSIAHKITCDFKELFVPKSLSWSKYSYTMEYVDTNKPVNTSTELNEFCKIIKQYGYIAFDYEMYLQPDGRIALIDFGRFSHQLGAGSPLT